MDGIYLPTGVSLKEPSRYKGAESYSILKLWRTRQLDGEVVFKFENYVGVDKEPAEPEYEDAIFVGLRATARSTHIAQDVLQNNSEDEEEESDDSEQYTRRRYRAAYQSDEEDDGPVGVQEMDSVTYGESRPRPRPQRRELSPIQDDPPRDTQATTPRLTKRRGGRSKVIHSDGGDQEMQCTTPRTSGLPTAQTIDSSPTLAGSSPLVEKPTRRKKPALRGPPQTPVLPTPGPSQTSTPAATKGARGLRSNTKAMAAAREEAATLKTRSKTKTKEGGRVEKGKKK